MRRFQDSVDDISMDDKFFYDIEDLFGPIECYFDVVTSHSILEFMDEVGESGFQDVRTAFDKEITALLHKVLPDVSQDRYKYIGVFHLNELMLKESEPVYDWKDDIQLLVPNNGLYDFVQFANGCYGFVGYSEEYGLDYIYYDVCDISHP